MTRTPPKKKAKEVVKLLRAERPDYAYLKSVFRALREELEIAVPRKEVRLPEVPTEEDIRRFYQAVWNCRNFADMVLIKTLFYTGVRVSELVAIRLDEVDVEGCQIRITQGKGSKDRQVPFPRSFRELLALHIGQMQTKGAVYLFESVRKHKYTVGACARCWLAMRPRLALRVRCLPTNGGTFSSPGSKKRALMTLSSSPTLGTPRANHWRSIPGSLWLMPKELIIRRWNGFQFDRTDNPFHVCHYRWFLATDC